MSTSPYGNNKLTMTPDAKNTVTVTRYRQRTKIAVVGYEPVQRTEKHHRKSYLPTTQVDECLSHFRHGKPTASATTKSSIENANTANSRCVRSQDSCAAMSVCCMATKAQMPARLYRNGTKIRSFASIRMRRTYSADSQRVRKHACTLALVMRRQ